MKLLFIVLLSVITTVLFAQKSVKIDKNGNYITTIKIDDVKTDKFFFDGNGVKSAIYRTSGGKLYYNRIAKSGELYKVYIKAPLDTFEKPYSIAIMDEHEVVLIYKTDTIHLYFENAYKLAEETVVFVKNEQ